MEDHQWNDRWLHAGKVAAKAIEEKDYSEKRLKEYDTNLRDAIGDEMKKYLKVKDYLLSLNDKELNSVANAFQDIEFEKANTEELVKNLIKVSPKAVLKLGKLF